MRKLLFGNRTLVLVDSSESEALTKLNNPFAILLPAETSTPGPQQKRMIGVAIAHGCVEFCCIGRYAEALHDSIDAMLEERELFNVVTTWHMNEPLEESIHYFINLAGSKPPTLVAVFDQACELQQLLQASFTQHRG
ncbi:MAG TPA: hypothetical protein PKI03_34320 [Pseudomonadota bacterium]|nr:hypothetical protein [Pseudomonadota bacterium]